ncbi:hypothetical protein PV08_08471 [Exophiala spinifera]|uniref:N-acetyltransferase domain-containing protein n=1 Tax=Exophiala spinifera TaxID=91928 RepID=A0A0D2B2X0_9EURO|nr:uncharacterized protein PV08_08471 [Exophiala spinifera]KIW13283.1 hypothetical protein PV08_08471 [Exophiala spinifera]
MRLFISRVEPKDMDAIVPLLFETFKTEDLNKVFFGRGSQASKAYTKKLLLAGLLNDPADVFIKLVDEDQEVDVDVLDDEANVVGTEKRKRIIAASDWKIYPTYVTPQEEQQQQQQRTNDANAEIANSKAAFSYLETEEERADAAVLMEDFLVRRRRECKEGHALCFLLFVDAEYQRKGHGRTLMNWGIAVADALMLPCWIEATSKGEGLYRQLGFEDKERVKVWGPTKTFLMDYLHMRRPATTERIRVEDGKMVPEVKA